MSLVDSTVHAPPPLPPYLADAYNLKPVKGVPTDEEVKGIHAVIRAMEAVSHIAALYNPGTAMVLSQHLFNVQMKIYRSQYSYALFPGEALYTPPELPAHITNPLEPVIGFPSDKQLISARAAVKASDSFLNTSMFDADLSMKLSQHLFNIQLARYIQDTTQATARLPSIQTLASQNISAQTADSARVHTASSSDSVIPNDFADEPGVITTEETATMAPELILLPDSTRAADRRPMREDFHRTETNQLLCRIENTLENVNQVLVGTQNSLAQGFNYHYGYSTGDYPHQVINHKGENPKAHGIPLAFSIRHSDVKTFNSNLLARSLRFYGIGDEMIEEEDELRIKEGKESEARSMLKGHVILG